MSNKLKTIIVEQPENYVNTKRFEDSEIKFLEDRDHIDKLKKENYNLYRELKSKDKEIVI